MSSLWGTVHFYRQEVQSFHSQPFEITILSIVPPASTTISCPHFLSISHQNTVLRVDHAKYIKYSTVQSVVNSIILY